MAKNIEELNVIDKHKKLMNVIKGLRDHLPTHEHHWRKMLNSISDLTHVYGYKRIDTPLVENPNLYIKTLGKNHRSIKEELCIFNDEHGHNCALRPEFTPAIIRSYLQHGLFREQIQPYRMFTIGPVFKRIGLLAREYQQNYQFNCEVIGENAPIVDSQLIILGYNFLTGLGITPNIQVNSWGCPECMPEYKNLLTQYFRQKRKILCENCQKHTNKEPWKIFNCKNEDCCSVKIDAPQTVDSLCDVCRDHFIKVLEYLDEIEIPYVLNSFLRRKQDYYSRTVFEFWDDESIDKEIIYGGGGRYDHLVSHIAGFESAGSGFAFNLDFLAKILHNRNNLPINPTIFLAHLGERAKKKALTLFERLRKENINVVEDLSKNNLRAQFNKANKLDVKLVLVLGQKEVLDDTIIIRDMEGGIQEIVDYNKVIGEVKKRLNRIEKEMN